MGLPWRVCAEGILLVLWHVLGVGLWGGGVGGVLVAFYSGVHWLFSGRRGSPQTEAVVDISAVAETVDEHHQVVNDDVVTSIDTTEPTTPTTVRSRRFHTNVSTPDETQASDATTVEAVPNESVATPPATPTPEPKKEL